MVRYILDITKYENFNQIYQKINQKSPNYKFLWDHNRKKLNTGEIINFHIITNEIQSMQMSQAIQETTF